MEKSKAQVNRRHPLLLFEMRGLPPAKLQQELIKSPLGRILAESQSLKDYPVTFTKSYFTSLQPEPMPKQITLKSFWPGSVPLPNELPPYKESAIPAIVTKKGGDYLKFWNKPGSFLSVMEDFYQRMRKTNQKQL